MTHEEIRNLKCATCRRNLLKNFGKEQRVCGYWGFPLSQDQRACTLYSDKPFSWFDTSPVLLETISFPKEMCSLHDYSDKRHTLKIDVACVKGVYYAGVHYSRHYDSMYGSGRWVSIYDGDFATADEAIKARIHELIREEEHNKCPEAVQFLKRCIFEQRQQQLSLF